MRSLFPIAVLAVAATAVYLLKRRERRHREERRISGGRKALVLNLLDRR